MSPEVPRVGPADAGPEFRRLTPPLDPWIEALRDLRERLVAAGEPFRTEFLELLTAAGGRTFGESNAAAAAEIHAVLGLLGLQFRDPDRPDRVAYLRCKQVPGTRGGAFELRTQEGGKQRILHSRVSLPDRLTVGDALSSGTSRETDLAADSLLKLPDGGDPEGLRSAAPDGDAASAE